MCGIVGYSGGRPVVELVLKGLKQLEYRGYDSAGIAFEAGHGIEVRKSEGKLARVADLFSRDEGESVRRSCTGIGHTRWATHGKPTTQNAHPHRVGHVVLVHNGIIENYLEIREQVIHSGRKPLSETDSELFGFLVFDGMEKGLDLVTAIREAFTRIEGQCSFVVMSEKEPGRIVGVRRGSPMVVAADPDGGGILASDVQPLIAYNRSVVFLEDGDGVVMDRDGVRFFEIATGSSVDRPTTEIDWTPERMEKGGYAHYMLKEIHEQPTAFIDTLNTTLDRAVSEPFRFASGPVYDLLGRAKEIVISACGTSWHAGFVGKYWIEALAGIPVQIEYSSELRYRSPVYRGDALVLGVSQSGETADTLAVLRDARSRGVPTIGITNVRSSTIARESDAALFTSAGPEIGVAATKTFTSQLITLLLIAGSLARRTGAAGTAELELLFEQTLRLPHLLEGMLAGGHGGGREASWADRIGTIASFLSDRRGFFFMGRGLSFPLALEGALKLKEIAYTHAEGYAAGELKHGPIAMIDREMAVVVIAPRDSWREKTLSNLEEVKARGATIVGIGSDGDERMKALCDHWIPIPERDSTGQPLDLRLTPFLVTPALQLLSYQIALLKGTDIDQPRNLAKSVTVE